ncbi:small subunit ribosomal protein S3e [Pancytospora epiphaga]|nr:small subunit ribosomal protein S3e [Pancytospora epiphaga]
MSEDTAILEKYINAGVIKAELKELCEKRFQTNCFAGLDLQLNYNPIKLTIKVRDPQEAIGENKFKLRQFQNMVAQRLAVPPANVDIIFEKIVENRLEPAVHAESLRTTFLSGKPYKRAINAIIRDVRSAGGQGVMVRVSGKIKGLRARSTKFFDGLLIQCGQPAKDYIRTAKSEAKCKQGVIGIQVSVMLPYDPEGIKGTDVMLPDKILILEPKEFN